MNSRNGAIASTLLDSRDAIGDCDAPSLRRRSQIAHCAAHTRLKRTFRLLSDLLARSAELGWKILKLREAVPYGQNGLSIIDVEAWIKRERWKRGRKHVHQTKRRVIGHQMTSAFLAILPLTDWRLLVHADVL